MSKRKTDARSRIVNAAMAWVFHERNARIGSPDDQTDRNNARTELFAAADEYKAALEASRKAREDQRAREKRKT